MTEQNDDLTTEAYQDYRRQLSGKPKPKKPKFWRTIAAMAIFIVVSFAVSVISYVVRGMLAGRP